MQQPISLIKSHHILDCFSLKLKILGFDKNELFHKKIEPADEVQHSYNVIQGKMGPLLSVSRYNSLT